MWRRLPIPERSIRVSVSRSISDAITLKVLCSFLIMVPMILGCGMYEKCMRLERLAPNGV